MDSQQKRALMAALGKFAVFAVGVCALVAVCTMLLVKALGLDMTGSGQHTTSSLDDPQVKPLPSSALPLPKGKASRQAAKASQSATPEPQGIQLTVDPKTVGSGEHINLTGTYSGSSSMTLQVQRKDPGGAWSDFPVTIEGTSGNFHTYVYTTHTGTMQWRVIDTSTKKASNAETVSVG